MAKMCFSFWSGSLSKSTGPMFNAPPRPLPGLGDHVSRDAHGEFLFPDPCDSAKLLGVGGAEGSLMVALGAG